MSGPGDFREAFRADPGHLDPLAPEVVDFDWAALEESKPVVMFKTGVPEVEL